MLDDKSSIGIVGIDDDRDVLVSERGKLGSDGHFGAGCGPTAGKLAIAETQNSDATPRKKAGQPINDGLGSRCRDSLRMQGYAIDRRRHFFQYAKLAGARQFGKAIWRQIAERIR